MIVVLPCCVGGSGWLGWPREVMGLWRADLVMVARGLVDGGGGEATTVTRTRARVGRGWCNYSLCAPVEFLHVFAVVDAGLLA